MPNDFAQRAINLLGGTARTASLLNISRPTVSQWLSGVRPVPFHRCIDLERLTQGRIRSEQLRPDLADRFAFLRQQGAPP
jgi:DNA-binding transcriptional regulator YdaS (Cro superfamily)